jgi:hypothetical protein
LGEVSVQTGRGYFTRLTSNTEVDVGGTSNISDIQYSLSAVGWHAIGNPFIMPVNVANLKFNNKTFAVAVTDGLIEGTLYRWKIDNVNSDAYSPVTNADTLIPWEGYWLKTKQANITITIPAPAGIGGAIAALPASFTPPIPSLAPPLQNKPIAKSQLELRFELIGRDSDGNPFSSDVTTVFGTSENAVNEWDALDQSEPPTLSQTVAAYFDHSNWVSDAGLYNSDYQPMMKDGEERIWTLTVYTKKPNAKMTLSWENTISQALGNVMLYFRRIDDATKDSEWQDMREIRSVEILSRSQVTKALFEIRAVYFEMTPPSDVQVIAGEKQVTIHWVPSNNAFVSGYTIIRQEGTTNSWKDDEGVRYFVQQNSAPSFQFIDTNVDEEITYTYQINTQFKTGAELLGELFTIRIKPVIKQTVLMQNYPNPFNPEVWIPFELSEQTEVSVQIYNASGQLVRILDLGMKDRGRYTSMDKAAYWNGLNEAGEKSSSGVYFYVLKAGKFTAAKKMVLVK